MAARAMIHTYGKAHRPVKFCGVRDVDMTKEELVNALRWAMGARRGDGDSDADPWTEEQRQDAYEAKAEVDEYPRGGRDPLWIGGDLR